MAILDGIRLEAQRIHVTICSVRTGKKLWTTELIARPSRQLTRRVLDMLTFADTEHGEATYADMRDDSNDAVSAPFDYMVSRQWRAQK